MVIGTDKFGGMAPKVKSHLLPNEGASSATNVKLMSGALSPFGALTVVPTVTVLATAKSIYRNPSSGLWSSFQNVTDIVRNPLANDSWDRVYWTDDDPATPPKMAANTGFSTSYLLGLPAPASAPSVSYTGDVGAEPLLAESRFYLTTYVTAYGEEGPPSSPSAMVTVYPDEAAFGVSVSVPGPPTGNYNITSVRIYRTNMGSTGTEYQLVATVAVGGTDYVDTITSLNLGVVLPSVGWDMPLPTLKGLAIHPSGFLVGFSGNEMCLSEKWLPHAWPIGNRYPVKNQIVSIGIYGASILVTTTDLPYVITGEDPATMTVEKVEIGGACLSKRATVDMGYYILYPTTEGLVGVGVGAPPKVITEGIIDPDTWMSYNPSGMIAERVGDRYLCICGSGSPIASFLFHPQTLDFMPLTLTANALYYDSELGDLFIRQGSNTFLQEWDNGEAMEYSWRSKEYRLPSPVNFNCGQVFADEYPLTAKFYVEGVLKFSKTVLNSKPFRMPAGYKSERVSYEVVSNKPINSVMFATSVAHLGGV